MTYEDTMKHNTLDLLETYRWIGRTAEDNGIEQNCRKNEIPGTSVDLTGTVNGLEETGFLYMDEDPEKGVQVVSSITVTIRHSNYPNVKKKLEQLFGKTISEGELPYAAGAGGSALFCDFKKDGISARLLTRSQWDYCTLHYIPDAEEQTGS